MLILPPCLGTCSVVLLRDPIPKKVIHASKYSHPQKDRNGAYHCIYLYIHRAYSNLVACTSTVSLVGVAVFHVIGTRACQPSKTLQNLPQVSLISPKHKDITSMLSILCGYQSCGY